MHRCLHIPLFVASCPTSHHVGDIPTIFAALTIGLGVLGLGVHKCGLVLLGLLPKRRFGLLHGWGGFLIFLGINKIRTCRTGYIKYII